MKIELTFHGPRATAALAGFMPEFQTAVAEDEKERDAEWRAQNPMQGAATEAAAAPVAAEVEKPKRGRAAKTAEPAPEPAPAIRATPEDRQPVEDAVVVAETPAPKVYVREDLRAALAEYVEVVGMARANETKGVLLGYAKFSEVPEDAKAFEAAVVRIREAIEKEKAIND